MLARLFNAGLIECTSGRAGVNLSLAYGSAWKIALTPLGKDLVEGWLDGDDERVEAALLRGRDVDRAGE